MRISQTTIESLAKKGITIKWYTESTYEEFKQNCWQQAYDKHYGWYKDHVAGSRPAMEGRTNILFDSIEQLEERCREYADNGWKFYANPYDYDRLYILYDNDSKTIVRKIAGKTKEITEDYVVKQVDKDRKAYQGTYGQFAIAMQEICKQNGLANRFSIYPTTYGIGVYVFWNWKCTEDIQLVETILKDRHIDYANEYSDARWVYRFKVSKNQDNLSRIFK